MKTQNSNFQIAYMPYLCMGDVNEVDFGFLKIWNFSKMKNSYILDVNTRNHIEKILKTYKSFHGPIVEGAGIISIGQDDFRHFNSDELEKIRLARLILFLSFISRNNTHKPGPNAGHLMATAENFDVVFQKFIIGDDNVSNQAGVIINFLSGGFKLNEFQVQKPDFVPTPFKFEIDAELFRALLDLQTRKPRVFQKVVNATEIFFQSYYNSPYVSKNARVLLQAGAFEILFNLPERDQRKHFKNIIGKLSNLAEDKEYTHYSERRGGRKEKEKLTVKKIWADTFFILRNHIIHGENPKDIEFFFKNNQPHTDIALLFFVLCVKKQIEKSLRQHPCDYEIKWEKWQDDLSDMKPIIRKGFAYKYSLRRVLKRRVEQHQKRKS